MMYDEGAHLALQLYGVTIPMAINGASISIFSTMPTGDGGYFLRMLHSNYADNKEIFYIYNMHNSCDLCRANGRSDECRHLRNMTPPAYQRASTRETVQGIMVATDAYEREIENMLERPTHTAAFSDHGITFFENEHNHLDTNEYVHIKQFVVAIDPAKGTDGSDCVIVSLCRYTREMHRIMRHHGSITASWMVRLLIGERVLSSTQSSRIPPDGSRVLLSQSPLH